MAENGSASITRVCQLAELARPTAPPSPHEQARERLRRGLMLARVRMVKALRDPRRALARVLRGAAPERRVPAAGSAPERLGLRPGERVRVRSLEEVRATLDEQGRYQGMGYLPAVMDRYCGQSFIVRGRVDRFFDERDWRMLRLRDTVILEGAYCLPDSHIDAAFAGCQRSCFLFWKEAWLERTDAEP